MALCIKDVFVLVILPYWYLAGAVRKADGFRTADTPPEQEHLQAQARVRHNDSAVIPELSRKDRSNDDEKEDSNMVTPSRHHAGSYDRKASGKTSNTSMLQRASSDPVPCVGSKVGNCHECANTCTSCYKPRDDKPEFAYRCVKAHFSSKCTTSKSFWHKTRKCRMTDGLGTDRIDDSEKASSEGEEKSSSVFTIFAIMIPLCILIPAVFFGIKYLLDADKVDEPDSQTDADVQPPQGAPANWGNRQTGQNYGQQHSNNMQSMQSAPPVQQSGGGFAAMSGPAQPAPPVGPIAVISATVRVNAPQQGPQGDFGLPSPRR